MDSYILKQLFSIVNLIVIFGILGKRKIKQKNIGIYMIFAVVISCSIMYFENMARLHLVYNYLTKVLLIAIYGKFICKYSIKFCLIINSIFLSFISLSQVIACTITYIQTEKFLVELSTGYQVQMVIISEIVIAIGMLILAKFVSTIPIEISMLNFITILIPNVISLTVIVLLGDKLYNSTYIFTNIESVITIMVSGIILVIGSMCNIVLFEYFLNAKQIEGEKKLQLKEMSLQYDYYVKLERDMDGIRHISHDIRNHLEALRGNNNEDQKNEYIGNIEEELNRYESYYDTGNTFIDNILHRKKLDAIEQKIELRILADLRPFRCIKNSDLCVIISNLLDNALRECRLRKEEEPIKENLIQLRIGKFKGFLSITCENSIRENQAQYVIANQDIKTTKSNKNHHGYGIKNINSVVQKYGGAYSIHVREGMFCFSIIIPV